MLVAGFTVSPAGAQHPAFNLEQLDQLLLAPPLNVTDVDMDGTLAVVGLGQFGVAIVDVSTPGEMEVAGGFNLPGQLDINDVQAANGRAYLSNAGFNGVAVYILDLTNPSQPTVMGAIIQPLLNLAHNVFIDGDILYVIGQAGVHYRTHIFDVSNPAVPVLLTDLPTIGAHDITVLDGILYEAGGWSGLHLWDVTDPAHPVHLAEADINDGPRPHYHTHSAWPTEDRRHILTMNEITSWEGPGQIQAGGLKVWAWDGGSELTHVASWQPEVALGSTIITIHNGVVRGRHAYVSYYQAGIRVLDLKVPTEPVEVGFYDTHLPAPLQLFEGCWGVDLGAASGAEQLVYASDRTTGLFQLTFNGSRRALLAGVVRNAVSGAPIVGASVRLVTADRRLTTDAAGEFSVLTGEGSHLILVTAPGYIGSSFAHDLIANNGRRLELKLLPDTAPSWAPARAADIRLEAGHPNPFKVATIIPFEVVGGEALPVKLSVHDVTGRRVRVLHHGTAAPGRHVKPWDGRDASGTALPAGMYYLRLSSGAMERCGRLQIIR